MDIDLGKQQRLIQNLRRALPLSAHARPALLTAGNVWIAHMKTALIAKTL